MLIYNLTVVCFTPNQIEHSRSDNLIVLMKSNSVSNQANKISQSEFCITNIYSADISHSCYMCLIVHKVNCRTRICILKQLDEITKDVFYIFIEYNLKPALCNVFLKYSLKFKTFNKMII